MARKFQPEESSGGVASWMVTYGDLMSLLLTFFVLLVSFSTIQEAKFYEAIQSLQGAFGVLKNPPTALEFNELLVPNLSKQERSEILHEFGKLEQSLLDEGLDTEVDIRMTGETVPIFPSDLGQSPKTYLNFAKAWIEMFLDENLKC